MWMVQPVIIIYMHTWQILILINKNLFFLNCKRFLLFVGTANCLVVNYNHERDPLGKKRSLFIHNELIAMFSHFIYVLSFFFLRIT